MECPVNRSPDIAEGETTITPHREHQANGCRLDGQHAHTDGYEHDEEIHIAPEWSKRILNDGRQCLQEVRPLRNALDLGIILDRKKRTAQEKQARNERESDGPQHASWSIALRI